MNSTTRPLDRTEVVKAVERRTPARTPVVMAKWWGEGLGEQYGSRLSELDRFREDAVLLPMPCPSFDRRDDGFFWYLPEYAGGKQGLDAQVRLPWEALDDLIAHPPSMDHEEIWAPAVNAAKRARENGMYTVLHHWSLMFERIWNFRGMENLLLDYYEEPENVHRLHRFICDTELSLLKSGLELLKPDAYMISDDLGSQRSLMMSPEMFREFIKPYYTEIWSFTHARGVHNWLHTCGCVTEILGDLIEAGLDVIHPIQKHTMDWEETANQWRGKISFLVGMDVQQTLIHATPEEVRAEVRLMKDTFGSPEGGLLLAAGNGIVGGTPFENIEAFLDECFRE